MKPVASGCGHKTLICNETRNSPPLFLLILFSILACFSYKEDDPAPVDAPCVRVTSGVSDLTALTFTVAPQHAERCAYLVVAAAGSEAVDAAAVLERGVVGDAAATRTYTVEGLESGTAYDIYAAVASPAGTAFDKVSMLTKSEPEDAPSVTLRQGEVTRTIITFTITPSDADKCGYMVVPATEQVPDAQTVLRDGSQADPGSPSERFASELMPDTEYIVVAAVSRDGIYGRTATLEVATLAGGKLPGLTSDVTGKVFTYVERSNYFGDLWGKGTGWFVYALRDCSPDENGIFPEGSAQLCFELHADLAASQDGVLPEGTYRVGSEIVVGACMPGRIIELDDGDCIADVTYYAQNGKWGMVDGGTVTIEKTADGYRTAFDLTTQDGHRITASYAGSLTADRSDPVDPDATTTLSGDYQIRFAEGDGTRVSAFYYGYDETLLADVWSVYMEPVRKDLQAEGFMMDLLVDPQYGFGDFPAGTEDMPHEYSMHFSGGEPGHYLPGEYDENQVMIHSWYLGGYVLGPANEWMVTRYAAMKLGFIYISRTDDTYTIGVEFSDESWHTVTGTWSGRITTEDLSAAHVAAGGRAPALHAR